jgi:hypothetical protein
MPGLPYWPSLPVGIIRLLIPLRLYFTPIEKGGTLIEFIADARQ